MRILISGECPTAKTLRGYLRRHDFHLTGHQPDWVVYIEEPEGATRPAVDGVGGALEQAILRHLRKQTPSSIELHTARTVLSEREIRVLVPPNETDRKAVETGVFRGLLEVAKQDVSSAPSQSRWWTRLRRTK